MFDQGRALYIVRFTYGKKQRKYNGVSQLKVVLLCCKDAGIILCMGLVNKKRRYTVTSSPIG